MFLQDLIAYINNLKESENEKVEIEMKVLLDPRIKSPNFIKPYFENDDFMLYVKSICRKAIKLGTPKIEQTINFIHTGKNFDMFVKQLCYRDGVQDPKLKNYYTKKSLITPVYFTDEKIPPYKLSLNMETRLFEDINMFDIARFRQRYSVVFDNGAVATLTCSSASRCSSRSSFTRLLLFFCPLAFV